MGGGLQENVAYPNVYSVVSLGWQWDAPGEDALRLYAPIAKENGETIRGLLRGDLMLSKVMEEIPVGHIMLGAIGGSEYPVADADDPRNVPTVRDAREAKRTAIPQAGTDDKLAEAIAGAPITHGPLHLHFPQCATCRYQIGVPSLSRKTKVSLPRVTSRAKIVSTPSNCTLVPTTSTRSPLLKTRS